MKRAKRFVRSKALLATLKWVDYPYNLGATAKDVKYAFRMFWKG